MERAKALVTTLFKGGASESWTAHTLGAAVTESMGTNGSAESQADHPAAAGWIIEGLVKSKAMVQQDDGSTRLTEASLFQYNNKSNFFSTKPPVGMTKVRQELW